MISVGVIFSSADSSSYRKHGFDAENLQALEVREFATAGEAEAYLKGVDEASGWTEYALADGHQLAKRGANPLLSVVVVFGKGAKIHDAPDVSEMIFTFSNTGERLAFEQGLKEGNGWADYCVPDDDDLGSYLKAKEQIGTDLTVHSFEVELTSGDLITIETFWSKEQLIDVLAPVMSSIKLIREVILDEYDYLDISLGDHLSLLEKFKFAIIEDPGE